MASPLPTLPRAWRGQFKPPFLNLEREANWLEVTRTCTDALKKATPNTVTQEAATEGIERRKARGMASVQTAMERFLKTQTIVCSKITPSPPSSLGSQSHGWS